MQAREAAQETARAMDCHDGHTGYDGHGGHGGELCACMHASISASRASFHWFATCAAS